MSLSVTQRGAIEFLGHGWPPPIGATRSLPVHVELKLSLVTSASRPILMRDRELTRRQARRLSRRFDGVGVAIPAMRLQQIAAGASAGDDELTDVSFALTATELQREERHAKLKRSQRRCVRWLIVAGLTLLVLNTLLCMAYLFLSLALHASPY
jgi:hypothetical protein